MAPNQQSPHPKGPQQGYELKHKMKLLNHESEEKIFTVDRGVSGGWKVALEEGRGGGDKG